MSSKAFMMLADSKRVSQAVKGTTVYAAFYDYGLANGDTGATGIPHMSVTLDPEGGGLFFTVPVADLKPLSLDHTKSKPSFWRSFWTRTLRRLLH